MVDGNWYSDEAGNADDNVAPGRADLVGYVTFLPGKFKGLNVVAPLTTQVTEGW
jgi:hypothetical protein